MSIRRWYAVHKWTSLVCTLFLLLLCVTGLPLIFHHELDRALGYTVAPPAMAETTRRANVDDLIADARARKPGEAVQYLVASDDDPNVWYVGLANTPDAVESSAYYAYDIRSGAYLHEYLLNQGVTAFLFHLHTDLFAGLGGTLLLGLMGILLVVSLVSGAVLYAPFTRKLPFGAVRYERAPRTRWLDLHNLLGIATFLWLLTVGTTGVINTLARPIFGYWQMTELASMIASDQGKGPLRATPSAQPAVASAQAAAAASDSQFSFMAFPGTSFASSHHFTAFVRGTTPLTKRLLKPMLIDAATGRVTDSRDLPWYAVTLLVSQPLHFGDYGGVALQIVWALLDLIAIVVLGSGVYLWLKKWNVPLDARIAAIGEEGTT